MLRLFLRVFLKPQWRHPALLITGILGVAFSVALFYAMSVASERSLATITTDQTTLFDPPLNTQLTPQKWEAVGGRIPRSVLQSCFDYAHRGVSCTGTLRLKLTLDQGQRVTILGIEGPFFGIMTPLFASDLGAVTYSYKGQPLQALGQSDQLRETIVVGYDHLTRLLGESLGFDAITLKPSQYFTGSPAEWTSLVTKLTANLPSDSAIRLVDAGAEQAENRRLTASYRLNLLILTAVSIMVAGLFLWNIATLQIQNRRQWIAVLRQQGIPSRWALILLLAEQFTVGTWGALTGLGFGVWLEGKLSALTLSTLSELYVSTSLMPTVSTWDNAVAALVFGVLFYSVACLQITGRLVNVSPNALRQSDPPRKTYPALVVVLNATAILLLPLAYYTPNFALPLLGNRPQPYVGYLAAFGIFVLVFGSVNLGNRVIQTILRASHHLLQGVKVPAFAIASRRYLRQQVRNRTAVATVASALALALGIALMVNSFRTNVSQWFGEVFLAEVVAGGRLQTPSSLRAIIPSDLMTQIDALPSTAGYDCLTTSDGRVGGQKVKVYGVTYQAPGTKPTPLVVLDSEKPMATIADFQTVMSDPPSIVINEPLANHQNLNVGDNITVAIADEPERNFTVTAVVRDYGSEGGFVLLPIARSSSHQAFAGCHSARFYASGPPDQTMAAIQALDPQQTRIEVQSTAQLRRFVVETFDRTFAITDVMTALAIILGGLALLVHVAQSTAERLDEWLTLRRVGATWRKLWQVAVWDSCFVIAAGCVLGLVGGLILAWLLVFVINVKSFGWSFTMPAVTTAAIIGRTVPSFAVVLVVLSAVLTLFLIRPGEKWQRLRE